MNGMIRHSSIALASTSVSSINPTRNNSGLTSSVRSLSSEGLFQGRMRLHLRQSSVTALSSVG